MALQTKMRWGWEGERNCSGPMSGVKEIWGYHSLLQIMMTPYNGLNNDIEHTQLSVLKKNM